MADREAQLAELMQSIREDAKEKWPSMDTNGDGKIKFEEFYILAAGEKQSEQMKEKLTPVF